MLTVIFPLLMLFLDPVSNDRGSVQDALWASQCLLGKEHLEGFIHNDAQKWVVRQQRTSDLEIFDLETKRLLGSPLLKCHLPKYRVNSKKATRFWCVLLHPCNKDPKRKRRRWNSVGERSCHVCMAPCPPWHYGCYVLMVILRSCG